MNILRSKRAGFTLIELIMVISIIGILAVIAIPRFVSLKDTADENRARVDATNLKTAIHLYRHDTGQYPGASGTSDITTTSGFDGYLVTNPGVSGWNGPYCERAKDDPWNNAYIFYNRFDTADYACVASKGANGSWESNLSSGTTSGDDVVIWME